MVTREMATGAETPAPGRISTRPSIRGYYGNNHVSSFSELRNQYLYAKQELLLLRTTGLPLFYTENMPTHTRVAEMPG
jgi:hypothetical protein